MMPYLCVALGGALGSVSRYGFGLIASRYWGEAFPWGTIAINILGSFVIGFFGAWTVSGGVMPASANVRAFVMVGICGGFTTFSSFSLQTFSLARDGNGVSAVANIALSVALCLLAVAVGQLSAERLGATGRKTSHVSHTVLALLDRPETARSVLTAAALVVDRLGGGRIEALHIRHDGMEGFMPTEDIMTEERRQQIDGQAASRSVALHAVFDAWQPSAAEATWQEVTGETAREVTIAAAGASMIVLGRPDPRYVGALRQAIHAALFDARRLTLLVPDTETGVLGQHVAVAWKPSAAVEKVIEAGWRLLVRAERVTVLIGAEEAGDAAEPAELLRNLAKANVQAEIRQFAAGGRSIGKALLAEAHLADADMLVMGAYTRLWMVEMVLGGATREVLADGDLPVLLQH